jgi:hypothetical protein
LKLDFDPDPQLEADEANFQKWMLDAWPNLVTSTDGLKDRSTFQNDIRTGLTAGANMNDEQKEQLRKTLFIFEEFYKSASALLAKLTQLKEKIASKIA